METDTTARIQNWGNARAKMSNALIDLSETTQRRQTIEARLQLDYVLNDTFAKYLASRLSMRSKLMQLFRETIEALDEEEEAFCSYLARDED